VVVLVSGLLDAVIGQANAALHHHISYSKRCYRCGKNCDIEVEITPVDGWKYVQEDIRLTPVSIRGERRVRL
jgi:hypothetical protein